MDRTAVNCCSLQISSHKIKVIELIDLMFNISTLSYSKKFLLIRSNKYLRFLALHLPSLASVNYYLDDNVLRAKLIFIFSEVWLFFLLLFCSSPKYCWLPAGAWKCQHCREESHLFGLWSFRNSLAINNMAEERMASHLEQLSANPLRYKSGSYLGGGNQTQTREGGEGPPASTVQIFHMKEHLV